MDNKNVVGNRFKIIASINNSKVYIKIREKFDSFFNYIWAFIYNKVIYNKGLFTDNELSDRISKDLKMCAMKFVGSIIIYSYLQVIGVINNHESGCYLYKEENL